MRIGILGGSFDPIHIAHLVTAEETYFYAKLDQVWFMPAKIPPHKEKQSLTDPLHRQKMIELAIAKIPYFHLSLLELQRNNISYTIDTVRLLKRLYPDDQFFWIMGSDMFIDFPNWYQREEIIQNISLLITERPDYNIKEVIHKYPYKIWQDKFHFIPTTNIALSSSRIRQKLKEKQPVNWLIPAEVLAYIKENNLYE